MARPKQHDKPVNISFQVPGEIWEEVKKLMLEEDLFNKSEMSRRIFEKGLQTYKENK
jgi:hypothetical protein